jgi:hypothetical protein
VISGSHRVQFGRLTEQRQAIAWSQLHGRCGDDHLAIPPHEDDVDSGWKRSSSRLRTHQLRGGPGRLDAKARVVVLPEHDLLGLLSVAGRQPSLDETRCARIAV